MELKSAVLRNNARKNLRTRSGREFFPEGALFWRQRNWNKRETYLPLSAGGKEGMRTSLRKESGKSSYMDMTDRYRQSAKRKVHR